MVPRRPDGTGMSNLGDTPPRSWVLWQIRGATGELEVSTHPVIECVAYSYFRQYGIRKGRSAHLKMNRHCC